MSKLIAGEDLPAGFSYPASFVRVVDLGLVDLEPWLILDGEGLYERYRGLQERYQARELVPFARRQDNDEVACWDVDEGSKVVIIHDFAELGASAGPPILLCLVAKGCRRPDRVRTRRLSGEWER